MITDLNPASKEEIINAHPEKYYDYVKNLWPKKYKVFDMTNNFRKGCYGFKIHMLMSIVP